MGIVGELASRREKLAVIGLGYVGLPIAVAFSKHVDVIGFDLDERRVQIYRDGMDPTGQVGDEVVRTYAGSFTSDAELLDEALAFIVAVPTPVENNNLPDLRYVRSASRIVAQKLRRGSVVIYESTVYPGVTEEICIPILEAESGLICGRDFKVGYSPERINPGDRVHRLENIVKIVSGNDEEALRMVASLYELIVEAGVYRAESIKVAEAAKVIENAQRDINIAFMNELSMMFHQLGIDTQSVLRAAGTKWNFLKFTPGLVGGHCISVDPYYLTYKAEEAGYRSRLIAAGRRINDGMGSYIARSLIKLFVRLKIDVAGLRVGILGLAYKENCSDIRNTKVMDIVREFRDYGIEPLVADPLVDAEHAYEEYGLELCGMSEMNSLDVVIVAVPHLQFAEMGISEMSRLYSGSRIKIMADIKGIYSKQDYENNGFCYWSL